MSSISSTSALLASRDRFLSSITAPVGGIAGGVLATQLGYRPTLAVTGLVALSGFALLLASPLRTLSAVPYQTV